MAHADSTLREHSGEHLFYEISMLFGAAQLFPLLNMPGPPFGNLGPITGIVRNAAVESFVTHVRNLTAFFFDRPKRGEAVTAEDFVRDVTAWRAARGVIGPILKRARARADRELSHLTTLRYAGTPPEKQWNPLEIFKEVVPLLRLFRQHAKDERLHPNVRNLIDQLGGSS